MKALLRYVIIALVVTACGDGRLSPQGGTITNGVAGAGMTGGGTGGAITFNVIGSSDFAVGADLIDLSNAVTAPGTLGVAGAVTFSTMTSGSMLFAGTAGLVSQDNANLFWDDANNRLGIGTAATPLFTLDVRNSHADNDIGRIQNTSASGYSTLGYYNAAGTGVGYLGFGNSSAPDTTVRDRVYWRTTTANMLMSYGAGLTSTPALFVTAANGNTVIGPTAGDPSVRLKVEASVTAQPAAIIVNTSSSGYSAIDVYNSSSAFQGGLGFGNSAVALTHLRGLHYWYSGSADHVFANATRNNTKIGMTADSAFVELANGASAAVSAASAGRIRYSTGTSTFQASLNTGAYANLITGTGTTGVLPKFSAGATSVLANSLISESGNVITVSTTAQTNLQLIGDSNNAASDAGYTGYIIARSTGPTELWYIGRNGTVPDDGFIIRRGGTTNVLTITTGDAATFSGTLTSTGLFTATVGGTTPLDWTTTGTGDLVSADDLSVVDDSTIGNDSTDRIGVGIAPDANHAMTFAQALGAKIALYPVDATNALGFGVQSGQLQVFVGSSANFFSVGVGDSDAFTERFRVAGNGQISMGDTAASGVSDNLDVLTIGNTGTGQTGADKALLVLTNSGTYTGVDAYGVRSVMTSTAVSNYAGYFKSTNATTNYGIWVDGSAYIGGNAGASVTTFEGHFRVAPGEAPTPSSCGSGPSNKGTDYAGWVTTGSGASACTLTFFVAYLETPTCVVTARSGTPPVYALASSTLTLTTAAASETYDYVCHETKTVQGALAQ